MSDQMASEKIGKKNGRFMPGIIFIALPICLLADQLSKLWMDSNLVYQTPTAFIPFLSFYLTYNDGVAFSMFAGFEELGLLALASAVLIFVSILWQGTEDHQKISRLGYATIWGGALGNVIDRATYGHVIDFLLFHTQSWSFAIFNLADAFITIGAALVILDEFLTWYRSRKHNG